MGLTITQETVAKWDEEGTLKYYILKHSTFRHKQTSIGEIEVDVQFPQFFYNLLSPQYQEDFAEQVEEHLGTAYSDLSEVVPDWFGDPDSILDM